MRPEKVSCIVLLYCMKPGVYTLSILENLTGKSAGRLHLCSHSSHTVRPCVHSPLSCSQKTNSCIRPPIQKGYEARPLLGQSGSGGWFFPQHLLPHPYHSIKHHSWSSGLSVASV